MMPSLCGLACTAGGGAGAPGKLSCLAYAPLCRWCGHATMNPAPYGSVCGWVPSSPALKGVGGLGVPLGAAPHRDLGGEELGGGVGSRGAGWETPCPACRDGLSSLLGVAPDVLPAPSSRTAPPDSKQLLSIHFYPLLPTSLNHQGATTKSLGSCLFPSASAILTRAEGRSGGATAPHLPHVAACGQPLSSLQARR